VQLHSHNYITKLCVLDKKLITAAGGLDPQLDEGQEYDLLLRCTALAGNGRIGHIPKVLYHHHAPIDINEQDLAKSMFPGEAGRAALERTLQHRSPGIRVHAQPAQYCYRIEYPVDDKPLVSLIIPTRDHHAVLKNCIDSILQRTEYPDYEIIVVDNQSADPATLAYLREITSLPNLLVINYDRPFNYSAINNYAAEHAKGDILGFLNNDTEIISADWLDEMTALASHPENGCIGAKLYYPDETIQHAGVILGLWRIAGHAHRHLRRGEIGYFNNPNVRRNVSAVTAACLLVRKQTLDEVGGFDCQFKTAYNDIDFCIRVRNSGHQNIFTPFAELYHHESLSRGYSDSVIKRSRLQKEAERLRRKHGEHLFPDPFYNRNLTLTKENYSLRD